MDIRKLEAFSKVFEYKSFSKAGKSLYLSQPTISAHVAALEQELGVQLFDRIGRTVIATKAGEILYVHAKKIFEASYLAISDIRNLQNRIVGNLNIGASTIPASYLLPKLISNFWHNYPEVVLDVSIGDTEKIISLVKDNDLMFGVVGEIIEGFELNFDVMMKDVLVLVVSRSLYNKFRHLSLLEMLYAVPWVMREEGSGTRIATAKALSKLGVDMALLNPSVVVRNAVAMSECLRLGMGAGITSYLTVGDDVISGNLISVELGENIMQRNFYLVYNKKRTLIPAAIKLMEYLKNSNAV